MNPNQPDWREMAGLTQAEVDERLRAEGYNELPGSHRRTTLTIALEVVREPMFLLLVAAGSIYFLLGDVGEASVLLSFVLVVMGITIYQEKRTERVLEALRDLTSPRALVIRDGQQQRIPGREVVRGDILLLTEGDRVPADAAVLSSSKLQIDESLLTGESVPVNKSQWDGKEPIARPGGDNLPFVYSGTLIVQGQAVAQSLAIGAQSEIGRIGKALQSLETEATPLQRQTRRLVRILAADRPHAVPDPDRRLWTHAPGLGRRHSRRHHPRHGDNPRRVPGGADRFSRARRLAHFAPPRAHPPRAGHRDAGLSHGAVRRQDRHPHPEPHGDTHDLRGGRTVPRAG